MAISEEEEIFDLGLDEFEEMEYHSYTKVQVYKAFVRVSGLLVNSELEIKRLNVFIAGLEFAAKQRRKK